MEVHIHPEILSYIIIDRYCWYSINNAMKNMLVSKLGATEHKMDNLITPASNEKQPLLGMSHIHEHNVAILPKKSLKLVRFMQPVAICGAATSDYSIICYYSLKSVVFNGTETARCPSQVLRAEVMSSDVLFCLTDVATPKYIQFTLI